MMGQLTILIYFQDNPVNMMLLAVYMKKNGWDYEQATDGLAALQAFQRRPQGFNVIFMGMLPHPLSPSQLLLSPLLPPFNTILNRCLYAHNDRLRVYPRNPGCRIRTPRRLRSPTTTPVHLITRSPLIFALPVPHAIAPNNPTVPFVQPAVAAAEC